MKNNNLHSFAILAYKKSPFLDDCILSLLKQTFKSNIYLFTSTPSKFLEEISCKYSIPLIINKNRTNPAADWSFAYNKCKTKYITFAHQDDIYLPNCTKRCLEVAENYPDNLITFTDYSELFNNQKRKTNLTVFIKRMILNFFYLFKDSIKSKFWKKNLLRFGNPICCPSVMYNKENIGKFEFNESIITNVDWDACIEFSRMCGDFVYVKESLMLHRIHKESETTKLIMSDKRKQADMIMFQKLWPKFFALVLSKLYELSYKSNK